jgi:hypothetical protein
MSNETKIIGGVILGLLACCCLAALVMVAAGGILFFEARRVVSTEIGPALTEIGPVLTEAFIEDTPTPKPVIITTPVPTPVPGSSDTLQMLEEELLPYNDLRLLAMRLRGIPDIPAVVSTTPADHPVGAKLPFYVSNTDTNETFEITAELLYKTENVYFFAEEGVEVNQRRVEALVDEFQNEIYPTNREFFGSEPNPGVDGDPRLYILYAHGMGFSIGGYASSADGYSRLAQPRSNEKEIFYINADAYQPGDSEMLSTLSHEFQHMIHSNQDDNEESWLNEGSSVLAQFLNGYTPYFDYSFVDAPDTQLNAWADNQTESTAPHYGAGFLFLAYFLDRFGSEATQALVADPANGLRSVDDVLAELNLTDPLTGQSLIAVDVFADWVVTNYLLDEDVADGRYTYHNYPDAPRVFAPTGEFSDCPLNESATVHQFAADYYEIQCSGTVTINFTGSQRVSVVPAEPHSGRYAFWSNRGDKSDMTLTREFDLSGLTSATLTYWTWFNIEEDYDYAYVEVSTNGGETWTILEAPGATDYNPTGNNFGWGFTANSGGGGNPEWTQIEADLSDYAGQTILVRFEYITDDALNLNGMLIDDIAIPELDYISDFEEDDGGWEGEGFVRIDNFLPQRFVVQAIIYDNETRVERLPLTEANTGAFTVELDSGEKVVLVVSGITPFTTELASYEFEVK